MSVDANEYNFEQAVLDRLDRIVDLLARGARGHGSAATASPATEVARLHAGQIVAEPEVPGDVGVIYVGRYKVRPTLHGGKLVLDLFAVGIQYEKFPLFSVAEAEWADPVKVPPTWHPEDFQDGTTAKCRARVTYCVGDKLKSSGNPYLDVLAVEDMPEGVVLPALMGDPEPPREAETLPASPMRNGGNGKKNGEAVPPARDADAPESARSGERGDQAASFDARKTAAWWAGTHPDLVAEVNQIMGIAQGKYVLANLEGREIAREMSDAQIVEIVRNIDAAERQGADAAHPKDVERELPPPPREGFDRGAAGRFDDRLNHWLTRGGLLIAELKQRFFPDALAAAGFLADLEAEGVIDRDEDANMRAQKALAAAAKRAAA